MQKNFDNSSMQQMLQLMNSPAGKQLINLLQQTNPESLQSAMSHASAGDMEGARKSLGPLLDSDEVKKLLQQLGG